jgi:hypothetical protein
MRQCDSILGNAVLGARRKHDPNRQQAPTSARAPTSQPNLVSGLSRERVEGRLALALRRLVSRYMGLRLILVRLRFLFFLISFLSLRHSDPPVCSLKRAF